MKICKMLKRGKAHRVFLSKQMAEHLTKITREKYNEGDKVIFCEMRNCDYAGAKMYDATMVNSTAYVCELGKITNKLESNVVSGN